MKRKLARAQNENAELQRQIQGLELEVQVKGGAEIWGQPPGYAQECTIPLPQDAQELRVKLADAFGMQLASVSMRARCAEGTGTPQEIWALLDTQSDLEAALQSCKPKSISAAIKAGGKFVKKARGSGSEREGAKRRKVHDSESESDQSESL